MEEKLIIHSKEIEKQPPLYLSPRFLHYILNGEGLSIQKRPTNKCKIINA
jgi:hypothetical protein